MFTKINLNFAPSTTDPSTSSLILRYLLYYLQYMCVLWPFFPYILLFRLMGNGARGGVKSCMKQVRGWSEQPLHPFVRPSTISSSRLLPLAPFRQSFCPLPSTLAWRDPLSKKEKEKEGVASKRHKKES